MTDKTGKPAPPKVAKSAERQARLADALRANLKRRKARARPATTSEAETSAKE